MRKDLEANSCIKSVPIFKNLTQEELDEVIMISNHQKLGKGDFIFQSGEKLHSLYVIHRGKVKITRMTEDGKEQVIRILSHGDFLGELALFNDSTVSSNAEAMEDSVICLVENKELKNLMQKSPQLSLKMMNELSNRLDKAEALIEQNNLYSADAKVARLLIDLAKDDHVVFRTTKVNLSSQIGITPETFSRKLKKLEDLKYIKMMNSKLVKIINKKGLEHIINPVKL